MIQISAPIVQGYHWKNQLAQAVRNPEELLKRLHLPETYLPGAMLANRLFPLRVPHSYLNRIQKANPDDPLLRQVMPLDLETQNIEGYCDDPVGDQAAQKSPGLLHKYPGRVLLIASAACAIHCRYCFRRNFPYNDANASQNQWQEVLDYLRDNRSVTEVILSGGDPLSLSDDRLGQLLEKLEKIPHVSTLRIHTRLPVVIPDRVTPALASLLSRFSRNRNVVVVLHINHVREIDKAVEDAVLQLRKTGATLLNQSVLLRGVNDSTSTLHDLSHTLFNSGILPYYLHQLDAVNGAAHFAVEHSKALQLHSQLRQQLPGYLVPRLVKEQQGELSKTPLF